MSLAARLFVARAQAVGRRAARKRRADLEREVAGYVATAHQAELEDILDRYPAGTARELRGILVRQSMTAYENRFPAIGRY